MNPAYARLLKYFNYDDLSIPSELAPISRAFLELAYDLVEELSDSTAPQEVTVGLRKLLEAKDCFIRARLP